jgi:large subunit ribosomal protein L24|tara:strand:- start:15034 stop:15351 length:318 start_codon:yes stop_codon:yes gene_type:complete
MQLKVNIKKGDAVKVLSGNAKGKEGRVLSVDRKKFRAIIEGLNMVTKHEKPNAKNQEGGIVHKEAPIHISNLMLVDSKGVASRIRKAKNNDGKTIRISVKSGEEI